MSDRFSRRDFVELAGLGLVGTLGACSTGRGGADAGSAAPDLVVFNANVRTVDGAMPSARAFAVKGGRFLAVGSDDNVRGLAGAGTRTMDAQGMTVVPGFIDCHNHAPGETLLYDVLVGNPWEVEFVTIDSIVDKLKARARETPAGTWVQGTFFDDTKVKDKRQLNVHDLDRVSTEHPVSVRHRGGHTTFYNSKAFELAGVTRDTPNPPGGTFDRDADGNLTGRVTDRANRVFYGVGDQAHLHAGRTGAARAATVRRTSRSSSCSTASPACTTRAATWRRCSRSAPTASCCTA